MLLLPLKKCILTKIGHKAAAAFDAAPAVA